MTRFRASMLKSGDKITRPQSLVDDEPIEIGKIIKTDCHSFCVQWPSLPSTLHVYFLEDLQDYATFEIKPAAAAR